MLISHPLHWFGKLPIQAEFLSSNSHPNLETKFQDWIKAGQNHIGAQLMTQSNRHSLYGYACCLCGDEKTDKFVGVLLTSYDSKGRSYPFVMIADMAQVDETSFITAVAECFKSLTFSLSDYGQQIEEKRFFSNLAEVLTALYQHPQHGMDDWVEFYPVPRQLALSVPSLTPILYRKLMVRG